MKNSLKQGKPLIWFARRQGTQRLKIQRLRDSFFSSSPSPPGQTVRGQATRRPPHLRPPRVRGLGVRWATEDSAGPRPAPRAFGAPRRPARCACRNCPDQSLRGPSERGPRGGRPLPVVGGGPPRMWGLYRYTLCKRKIQQRARTDRPLVAGCFTPLEGRAGRASSAGRPAGRRQFPGWDTRFPPRKVPVLPHRWTGPGGTRTDEPREKAPFSSSAKSPQDPSRPGGRHHKHGRDQKAVSVGFLSKNAPPGFRVRASFVPSWETRFPPSDVKR